MPDTSDDVTQRVERLWTGIYFGMFYKITNFSVYSIFALVSQKTKDIILKGNVLKGCSETARSIILSLKYGRKSKNGSNTVFHSRGFI